ncbi:hypothetical protein [Simiduia aestuariiviva]|uniref:Uncharacterized protein n=1 Tax=Simiduia aestuariiviva TaxID=1510459 RepID=A0A839UNK3_9GAMM|nr:hypothetical protein [Simiduia aestuariiviva]MBB3166955.1 hypothetical protein [Simiduia aestuariiviva]MBB3166959.1 hypothetical protein [Simiduia aestuariiviva]
MRNHLVFRLLRIAPFFFIASLVVGVIISVVFNDGSPSDKVLASWAVFGSMYFLVYILSGAINGEIYLWSAGTYTKKSDPIMFKVSIYLYSLLAVVAILLGIAEIVNGS